MAKLGIRVDGLALVCILGLGGWLLGGCGVVAPNVSANSTVSLQECPPIPTPDWANIPTDVPRRIAPTSAPPPTDGLTPPFLTPEPPATLAVPLTTREQVLESLYATLKYSMAGWEEPWCVETLAIAPDRILFEHFDTVKEAGSGRRFNATFEPVWVVTIRGKVLPPMIGWRTDDKAVYVSYTIGEKSGMLYMMEAGMNWPPPTYTPLQTSAPKTPHPPRTRKPRATGTPLVQTPTAQ